MNLKIRERRSFKYVGALMLLSIVFCSLSQGQLSYASTPNQPPIVVASERIPKQTVTLGQSNIVIDLSKLFYDADDDTLMYKAVPDKVGLVSTNINSSLLTIETLAPGKTRIKVSADDGKLGRANSSFEIEILPSPNSAPVVAQTINNQTVAAGSSSFTVDASNVFTDADNDTLTLNASSSDDTVATAHVNGTAISITPGNPGTSTITVTADDGNGGSASTTFVVTIASPSINHDPVAVKAFKNQRATIGGSAWNIEASGVFTDADNDSLTFSASSSDGTVAMVSFNGTAISITSGIVGTSIITVTADDGNGGSVSTTFTVTVDKPALFISDFIQGDEDRVVLELFNPTESLALGYQLEIHQYNTTTNQHSSGTLDVSSVYPNTTFIVINYIFYDFFDITSSWYYNEEYGFSDGDASKITVAIDLKDSNGKLVDRLGDPNSTTAILPNNGGYVRDKRLQSGSSTFDISEWNLLVPGDYSTVGHY